MATNLFDILGIGLLGVGIYYAYSTGMFNSILGGGGAGGLPPPPIDIIAATKSKKKDDDDDDDDEGGGGGEYYDEQQQQQYPEPQPYPPGGPDEQYYQQQQQGQQQYPPYQQQQQQYQQPQQPPPVYQATPIPPPPGMLSSLYPMPVSQNQPPPYVSQTVGTYSPYSPYNQFNVYREYATQPSGHFSTFPDDNVNFSDIDVSKPGCYSCKSYCRNSPYGYNCARCRMPCKRMSHTYMPSQRGWDISPVGTLPANTYAPVGGGQQYSPYGQQSPYGGYLGMIGDWLTGGGGRGATFAEMDDYSKKRRFDCHNKLKKRVHGKDNQFVKEDDYYNDFNRIQFNIE